MTECSKHKTAIDGASDLGVLAEAVGDLRYDALQAFLAALAAKLARDAVADRARRRPRLARSLNHAGDAVGAAADAIGEAWRISKPHMDVTP